MRLAMAYGTALKKGAIVCTSRDTSRVARALKRAVIARPQPEPASHVEDLELADRARSPASRCATATPRAASRCGSSPGDPDSVELRFFDADGRRHRRQACSARSSGSCYREDFRRAFAGDIGDIVFPPRAHRVLHGGARPSRRHRPAPRPPVQGRARLLVRRRVDRHAGRARQARAPRCSPSTRTPAPPRSPPTEPDAQLAHHRRPGPRVGQPTSATSSTPTARPRPSSTTGATSSPTTEALAHPGQPRRRGRARRAGRAAGVGHPGSGPHRRRRRRGGALDQARRRRPDGGRLDRRGATSPRRATAGSSGPTSCPPTTPWAP